MRPPVIFGLVLILVGILILSIRSVTYFSSEQEVGPIGFMLWNVTKPHTIVFNPIAGSAALAVGLALAFWGSRREPN